MDKKAIIHVEDSTNVIELAKFLVDAGWTLFSANATEELLKKENIPCTREPILSQNNFYINDTSQLINKIINTKLPQDSETEKLNPGEESYYLLCLNIAPKISDVKSDIQPGKILPPAFQISAVIRNAFVNYDNILILTDPTDYKEAMVQIRTDSIDTNFRAYLAAKALNLVSSFDAGLSNTILSYAGYKGLFLKHLAFPLTKAIDFQHGANSHQRGTLYLLPNENGEIPYLKELQNKKISFNMVNDISFAWEQISILYKHLKNQFVVDSENCEGYHFTTHFTPLTGIVFTVVVKFNSIVGAALSANAQESFLNAFKYDSDLDGLTLGCSSVIDDAAAREIIKSNFSAIIAPDFTEEAKEILYTKEGIHLIPAAKTNIMPSSLKLIDSGILYQTKDDSLFTKWHVKTNNRPSQYITDEMAFGTLLAMSGKTHCAILLKNNAITGIGQGCLSARKAVEQALAEAKNTINHKQISGTLADLLICDTQIALCDSIKELVENGLSAIIQTGGAPNDDEFIQYCNDHGIVMVFTNMSHISF